MPKLLDVLQLFPQELKLPILQFGEAIREELLQAATKADVEDLRTALRDLALAQRRTEERIEELAEAQKRTELRVEELAEAQKRTELRVEELAEAQKKTEKVLQDLVVGQRQLREMVGGLSHAFGYRLEDESYIGLPSLLRRDFGVILADGLKRGFIDTGDGKYLEVNILGQGKRDGTECVIVGEAKTQLLRARQVDRFLGLCETVARHLPQSQVRLMVTHYCHPELDAYARGKGVRIYYSHEVEQSRWALLLRRASPPGDTG